MKLIKVWALLLLAPFLFGLFLSEPALALNPEEFKIKSFEADYYLGRDNEKSSTLRVVEKIIVEFPNFDQNHGILRAIPKTYQNHDVDLKVKSIKDSSGKDWNYSSYDENDNLVLKIGDADKYVRNQQIYLIEYNLTNVTLNLADHEEFYWDVNGDQWGQTFDSVTARIHVPKDIAAQMLETRACFAGKSGSTAKDCDIAASEASGDTLIKVASTRQLSSRETLTFVLGFKKDTFAAYHISTSKLITIISQIVFLGVLPPGVALYLAIRHWRRSGRDPVGKGTIVPEYLPLKDLSVNASYAILKESFAPSAISAQIVDLAVRHYLKIYETKQKKLLKDKITYEIELVKSPVDLLEEEQKVVEMLFGKTAAIGTKVTVSSLTNKLYKEAAELGKIIDSKLTQDGYFAVAPDKARAPWLISGGVLLVASFFALPWSLGFVLAGIILLVASGTMPARTAKGVEKLEYLYGLRDYMKLAEADRLKVLQGPKGELTQKIDVSDNTQLVKLYEKLLPYAMIFGIEKEWAKEFAQLYTSPPDWYSSSAGFNSAVFASSLGVLIPRARPLL